VKLFSEQDKGRGLSDQEKLKDLLS